MKKLLHPILLASALGLASPVAMAGDNVVMVELFTSQGCSSCPPADHTLGRLADRDDVLPLSMHVDYWDYLGWRDTFGSPEHTKRQYAYRDTMGARVVYTPQMVVQGSHDVPGCRGDLVEAAIAEAAAATSPAQIRITREPGMASAEISTTTDARDCTVWMASYQQEAVVRIDRGENAGETMTYSNVVDKLMKVRAWDGSGPLSVDLPVPQPGHGVAIWLQDNKTGRILAASFFEE